MKPFSDIGSQMWLVFQTVFNIRDENIISKRKLHGGESLIFSSLWKWTCTI